MTDDFFRARLDQMIDLRHPWPYWLAERAGLIVGARSMSGNPLPYLTSVFSASPAAAMVAARSSSVWAALTKPASYRAGAM